MKRQVFCILVALCILLALTACQDTTTPTPDPVDPAPEVTEPEDPASAEKPDPEPEIDPNLSQRDREWIEDIEYLRTEYKERHMDPFYLVSEEEFDWKLDRIITQVSDLSDAGLYFEINAAIAGMGDVHTAAYVWPSLYDRCFPVRAHYFDGKLYLTGYLEGYEEFAPYLLREIVAVNGVDIAYINQKVDCLYGSFNRWMNQARFPSEYFVPAFFDWAGCDYTEGYTFQILNENQEVESVEIPTITYEERLNGRSTSPENWDGVFYLKGGNWVEYYNGENGGYIYMSLEQLPIGSPSSMLPLAAAVSRQKEAHPECKKLVVDLRLCPGGDASVITGFQDNIEMLQMEQVYVVTGGVTASAATVFMSFFKEELGAVIIGEPTGQFPLMFHLSSSSLEPAVLPNSQITIEISDDWYDPQEFHDWEPAAEAYYDEDGKLYPWEYAILPDVYVYQDIEDIRQGKDSVLQWVSVQ